MASTSKNISKIKDRVTDKTRKTYQKISDGIKGQDKEYELVFTVRKHHLRH